MDTPPAGYEFVFSTRALRDRRKLDPTVARAVARALTRLLARPSVGDVRSLTGRPGEYRLRVGDWRVILRRDDGTRQLVVERILPRGRAYDR